jgi:hypothetical protein
MATIKGGDKADNQVIGTPAIPVSGDLIIDASSMASYLIDLEDGATQGMRREQPGMVDVIQEVSANQKLWGAKAGVTVDEATELVTSTAQITQIRAYRPAVAKLLEMLDETEAKLDDRRDTLIRIIAESVDAKAKSVGPDLFAKYEKTRTYRSAVGNKAAKTRKKNAKAKAPKGETAEDSADTATPA